MGQAYHARVSQGISDKILDTQPDRQMEVQVARFDAWVRVMNVGKIVIHKSWCQTFHWSPICFKVGPHYQTLWLWWTFSQRE